MEINYNKLRVGEEIELEPKLFLKIKEIFGYYNESHIVFEIDARTLFLDVFFDKTRQLFRYFRNDDRVEEVFLTLECNNKQNQGKAPHGCVHMEAIYRVKLK